MLASGSLASASSAAWVIAATFRSASARRRFGADASVFVFAFGIGSMNGHRLRVQPQLREEVLCARENRKGHQASERSDGRGDEERVSDPGCCLRPEDRPAGPGG